MLLAKIIRDTDNSALANGHWQIPCFEVLSPTTSSTGDTGMPRVLHPDMSIISPISEKVEAHVPKSFEDKMRALNVYGKVLYPETPCCLR